MNAGRRHGYQIEVEKKGYNRMRNKSLPNRTATTWNILSLEVVMAGSTKVFKSKFDEHMRPLNGGDRFLVSKSKLKFLFYCFFGITIIRLQA